MTAHSTTAGSIPLSIGSERDPTQRPILGQLVLARASSAGGASKSEIIRDLAPLLAPRFDATGARAQVELTLAGLVMEGSVREFKARFFPSDNGLAEMSALLGPRKGDGLAWSDVRDVRLLGAALGMVGQPANRYKALASPDGIRALVLVQAFDLKLKPPLSPSRVRVALAMAALERAFGNTVKGGLGSGKGLPAKAARLLAGQLSRAPRDFGTDSRLVAALAAEQAGVESSDIDALKLGVLRRYVSGRLAAGATWQAVRPASHHATAEIAGIAPPDEGFALPGPHAANDAASARPDLKGFAARVIDAARTRADGWAGNRKAFISHVWETISETHPQWRLSEIEFKCMLAEAHRAGHVVLANADLKDKRQLKEFQASAVSYKNTIWHFVRVEE